MATKKAAPAKTDEQLIRIQHAVVIQKGSDLRALNDLLSVGWKAASSSSMGSGVLVILENFGSESTIEEMRAALGYSGL